MGTIACSGMGVDRSVGGGGIKTYDKATYVSLIKTLEDLLSTIIGLRESVLIDQFCILKARKMPTSQQRILVRYDCPLVGQDSRTSRYILEGGGGFLFFKILHTIYLPRSKLKSLNTTSLCPDCCPNLHQQMSLVHSFLCFPV